MKKEKITKKGKNAFDGWFLVWIMSMFASIYAKAGNISEALDIVLYLRGITYFENSDSYGFEVDENGDVQITDWYVVDEDNIYGNLIAWLDEIYEMSGVDINFKNTLIVVRKEWESKVT